jgi:hypothetical protein
LNLFIKINIQTLKIILYYCINDEYKHDFLLVILKKYAV